MILTIFTGIHNGSRFFDHYLNDDIELNEADYSQDSRFDFELGEHSLELRMDELASDEETFFSCLNGISQADKNRFIHRVFRSDIERELLNDAISEQLTKIVVDEWIADCLIEVKRKYGEGK